MSNLGQMNDVIIKDFYIYQQNFLELPPGGSSVGNINIQADSDFVLQKLTYFGGVNNNIRIVPNVNVQITDSGSGRNLFEESVPVAALFGSGELPFILPTPKLFPARSTIQISAANSSTATANLQLSFIGYKAFRKGM